MNPKPIFGGGLPAARTVGAGRYRRCKRLLPDEPTQRGPRTSPPPREFFPSDLPDLHPQTYLPQLARTSGLR